MGAREYHDHRSALLTRAASPRRVRRVRFRWRSPRYAAAPLRLVTPPLVDCHLHLDASLTAGRPRFNESGTLIEGIHVWGELKESLTADDVYWGTRLACVEMIRTGTTTFCEAGTLFDENGKLQTITEFTAEPSLPLRVAELGFNHGACARPAHAGCSRWRRPKRSWRCSP